MIIFALPFPYVVSKVCRGKPSPEFQREQKGMLERVKISGAGSKDQRRIG
jgi:hypothetical protein